MAFGPIAPLPWERIPKAKREASGKLDQEWCVIGNENFFIRGNLELPLRDGDGLGPFTWIVWVSLSWDHFDRTRKMWNDAERVKEPPYFGWLCTDLPGYSKTTLVLKTSVITREVGLRPKIEVQPCDHQLAFEQRDGISMARVRQLAEIALHPA